MNEGVEHGRWGERWAVRMLESKGYVILDRNARPSERDRRYEIDIVAFDPEADALVFVEVKQHKRHSPWERRLRSITTAKRRCLRRACDAWRHRQRWTHAYRFDVVEIFGEPPLTPEIDHIEDVRLFVKADRFVKWG